jgi:hypothetical protein
VIPEPRRLVELARIGGTTIEWVLTGQHWENGSRDQRRVSSDVLATASLLREIGDERRAVLDEALRILRAAVQAVEDGSLAGTTESALVREHAGQALKVLEAATQLQRAIVERVMRDAQARLGGAPGDPQAGPAPPRA